MGFVDQVKEWVTSGRWKETVRHPYFFPSAVGIVGLILMYLPFLVQVGKLWKDDDYYSHGFLVPLLVAWQFKVRKPDFAKYPIKNGTLAAIFLLPLSLLQLVAYSGEFWVLHSISFVAASILTVWIIFGFRWALISSLPLGFLLFAFPVWSSFIDNYTNPLQILSTAVAERLLALFGFNPMKLSPTEIQLNNFALNVEVPCSGLKLLVAVACFTTHFVLIARNTMSFNVLMFILVLPLCLFINGLRIALIGVVGDMYGSEAGMKFHDYSGYITLLVCFYILFKFARLFGWKD